ncbi:hypothetical protein ACG33_12225 [Steroidobacter denitrificans]|uniref:Lipoprotein n=1 Tax=Steroidobacter denitrificans TaxID=465721 RepID=A0A127FDS8_STEDE|nr:hypothetical protein [Steroidobacter denitrificans]AMN47851.1 hypothetical protein ACG33_12225 [Steroidobacter denitrificans]
MIPFQRLGFMMFAWLLLAACGSSQAPASRDAEPADSPDVRETVLDDMVGTMDRAREVEDITRQHKQALDRALERAEGGDP